MTQSEAIEQVRRAIDEIAEQAGLIACDHEIIDQAKAKAHAALDHLEDGDDLPPHVGGSLVADVAFPREAGTNVWVGEK